MLIFSPISRRSRPRGALGCSRSRRKDGHQGQSMAGNLCTRVPRTRRNSRGDTKLRRAQAWRDSTCRLLSASVNFTLLESGQGRPRAVGAESHPAVLHLVALDVGEAVADGSHAARSAVYGFSVLRVGLSRSTAVLCSGNRRVW